MDSININITINEGKTIFKALTELPFKRVYELIGKINQQSNNQVVSNATKEEEIVLELTQDEVDMVIEALSDQPFIQVSGIMGKLYKYETSRSE